MKATLRKLLFKNGITIWWWHHDNSPHNALQHTSYKIILVYFGRETVILIL